MAKSHTLIISNHTFNSCKMILISVFIFVIRYVDMIANHEVADVFRIRAKVVKDMFSSNGEFV